MKSVLFLQVCCIQLHASVQDTEAGFNVSYTSKTYFVFGQLLNYVKGHLAAFSPIIFCEN